jgi:UDP-N-acetylglucosamine:LPS N-acetylglucosamine transferase
MTAPRPATAPPRRILLVANAGGHLLQLRALEPAWNDLEREWVTISGADSTQLLAGERVIYAYGPTPRSIRNLLRNVWLADCTVRRFDPDVILSTGAAIAVPFFLVGRLRRKRLVYVESFTRITRPGLTGRLVYPLSDSFFVQWRRTAGGRRAIYAGSVV